MTSLCLTYKSIRKQRQFTQHEYHKHRPRKVLFSEYVCFVQICPVFAGPVTNGKFKPHNINTYTKVYLYEWMFCFILKGANFQYSKVGTSIRVLCVLQWVAKPCGACLPRYSWMKRCWRSPWPLTHTLRLTTLPPSPRSLPVRLLVWQLVFTIYYKTFVVLVVHNQSANNYCPSWFALQSIQFKLPVFPLSEQIWHFYCFHQNLL